MKLSMFLASMTSLYSTIIDIPIDVHKSVINASHWDLEIIVSLITYLINLSCNSFSYICGRICDQTNRNILTLEISKLQAFDISVMCQYSI